MGVNKSYSSTFTLMELENRMAQTCMVQCFAQNVTGLLNDFAPKRLDVRP